MIYSDIWCRNIWNDVKNTIMWNTVTISEQFFLLFPYTTDKSIISIFFNMWLFIGSIFVLFGGVKRKVEEKKKKEHKKITTLSAVKRWSGYRTEPTVGEKVQNNFVPETEVSGLWDKELSCT